MHDVNPRDGLDRAAFFIAFLAGVAGSILIKAGGGHPFLAAGYAALVLFAYAFVAWVGGRIKLEPETIGDNCYYLGFLFTLASLAYTLYRMADPSLNGGRPVDIPDVISGFGVALSSTIVGVFLRVWLMQLRPDFVAKDREVRADVNRSMLDFRRQMAGSISQVKAFTTESIQMTSERDQRIKDSTEQHLIDHKEALKASAKAMSDVMKETFTAAMKEVVQEISEANKVNQAQIKSTLDELIALKDRLKEQEADSFEQIGSRRRVLIKELEEHYKKVVAQNEVTEANIRATRRAADAMTKRILPALDSLKERIDALPQPLQRTDVPFQDTSEVPSETKADVPFQKPGAILQNPWDTTND